MSMRFSRQYEDAVVPQGEMPLKTEFVETEFVGEVAREASCQSGDGIEATTNGITLADGG